MFAILIDYLSKLTNPENDCNCRFSNSVQRPIWESLRHARRPLPTIAEPKPFESAGIVSGPLPNARLAFLEHCRHGESVIMVSMIRQCFLLPTICNTSLKFSVPNMTSAVAFGQSETGTSIFKTALERPSLADFAQLGNVHSLGHGPRVLAVWTDQTIVRLGRPLWTCPPFGTLLKLL
jgi:hypothetical protein